MSGENNKIVVGGAARLKSGGPDMAVEWVGLDDKGREYALCSWPTGEDEESSARQFFLTVCLANLVG